MNVTCDIFDNVVADRQHTLYLLLSDNSTENPNFIISDIIFSLIVLSHKSDE